MKLYAPSTIEAIKEKHRFQLSKSLGQNFITDKNVIERIVEGAGPTEDDLVIEIGPGIGVLTAEAAQQAAKVVAIEIDSKLIPILDETLAEYDNVEVINQDILKTDLNGIMREKVSERYIDPNRPMVALTYDEVRGMPVRRGSWTVWNRTMHMLLSLC